MRSLANAHSCSYSSSLLSILLVSSPLSSSLPSCFSLLLLSPRLSLLLSPYLYLLSSPISSPFFLFPPLSPYSALPLSYFSLLFLSPPLFLSPIPLSYSPLLFLSPPLYLSPIHLSYSSLSPSLSSPSLLFLSPPLLFLSPIPISSSLSYSSLLRFISHPLSPSSAHLSSSSSFLLSSSLLLPLIFPKLVSEGRGTVYHGGIL